MLVGSKSGEGLRPTARPSHGETFDLFIASEPKMEHGLAARHIPASQDKLPDLGSRLGFHPYRRAHTIPVGYASTKIDHDSMAFTGIIPEHGHAALVIRID